MAVTKQQVAELYVATFNRAPDAGGLDYWVNKSFGGNPTIEQIAQSFFDQPEAREFYPEGTTNTEFVTSIYDNLFNRVPDAAGLAYWVAELDNGTMTRSVMIEAMKNGALGTDVTIIANKAIVGLAYAAAGLNAANFSLASVTADAATVSAALSDVSDLANPGSTFALTSSTADVIVTTAGNDTITATTATDDAGDMIIDASSTDNDTLNYTVTANTVAFTATKIENINVTTQTVATVTVDVANFSGVENLTVVRDDLASGQIDGTGAIVVNNLNTSKVAKITTGLQVNALDVNYTAATGNAGAVVEATGVTGNVTVDGSASITANDSTGTVAIDGNVGAAAEDAKASTINAAKAAIVTTDAGLTGAITVNAAKATTATVNNAEGGATVTAATAATAAATITVKGIDDSGATITAGTGAASTTTITVNLDGTAGSTDVATINAAGIIAVDVSKTTAAVDTLNLTATTAAATYTVAGTNGGFTTIAASGTNAVNVKTTGDLIKGKTATGVNELTVTAASSTAALDLSKVAETTTIILAADNANDAITAKNGAILKVTAATQTTGLNVLAADSSTVTIIAGDNTTTTAQSTTTLNAMDLSGADDFTTVTLVAEESRIVATSLNVGTATVVINGDENVTLGTTVAADSINASGLTGILSMTASAVDSVTSGSGADVITLNNAGNVVTLDAGAGNNHITITNVGSGSTVLTGSGTDTIEIDSAIGNGSYVIQGGAGNDTYNVSVDADVVIADEAGTADTIVFDTAGALDFSNNPNFAFSGIETLNISAVNGAVTMDFADLSAKTLVVTAAGGNDSLVAKGTAAADTIDFSGITTTTGAILTINGGVGADTLIGSNSGTTFTAAATDIVAGETITGGTGTDILSITAGSSVDLTVATVTSIETLATAGASATIAQGTGITSVTGYDDGTADTFIVTKGTTSFATLAGSAGAVDVAGEYYFVSADASSADSVLTYFDEVAGEAITITLVGTNVGDGTGTNDSIAVVAGNLVISIA